MSQMTIFDCIDDVHLMNAAWMSEASRDPSTKTGCVLVSPSGIVSGGYNTFPPGVEVTEERMANRDLKYPMTIHAELHAILNTYDLSALFGATAYLHPWPPCAPCAGVLIAAGITRVVAPEPTAEQFVRWGDSFALMKTMFNEAGVTLDLKPN